MVKEIEEPPGEEWNVIEDTDNFLLYLFSKYIGNINNKSVENYNKHTHTNITTDSL